MSGFPEGHRNLVDTRRSRHGGAVVQGAGWCVHAGRLARRLKAVDFARSHPPPVRRERDYQLIFHSIFQWGVSHAQVHLADRGGCDPILDFRWLFREQNIKLINELPFRCAARFVALLQMAKLVDRKASSARDVLDVGEAEVLA